jgi:hypothetical protein
VRFYWQHSCSREEDWGLAGFGWVCIKLLEDIPPLFKNSKVVIGDPFPPPFNRRLLIVDQRSHDITVSGSRPTTPTSPDGYATVQGFYGTARLPC